MRALLVVCLALAATVAEADVGIGVSAHSGDATVYVPIVTKKLLLEPYLTYAHQKLQSKNGTSASPVTSESTTIGIGVFGVKAPAPNVSIYFGARLAHLRDEGTLPSVAAFPGVAIVLSDATTDGNSIAPTVGFQYHLLDRLTLGGEVAVEYSDVDTKSTVQPTFGAPIESHQTVTRTVTRTNIILRYFF